MHEAAVAVALVEQVDQIARQNNASRVCEIEVRLGEMEHVVPEALETAFEAASVGTAAEGAKLNMIIEKVVARCRRCDLEFSPDLEVLSFLCPQCQLADVEMVSGHQVVLQSVICDQAEEAEPL